MSPEEQKVLEEIRKINDLKNKIKENIPDEDKAARSYMDQARLSTSIGPSVEYRLSEISRQESIHSQTNKKILNELDQMESQCRGKQKDIQRKKYLEEAENRRRAPKGR